VCRYNQLTRRAAVHFGRYSFAAKALGGNTAFSRFLATYHTYYKANQFVTRLPATLTLGGRNFLSADPKWQRDTGDFDRLLPISERSSQRLDKRCAALV